MKQHLEEEDLILHFYGESESEAGLDAAPHLAGCLDCRQRYHSLQRVLNSVEGPAIPHRGSEYETEIWNRLAPKLGQKRSWRWFAPRRWAPVLAGIVLLVTAFFAGRYSPRPGQDTAAMPSAQRERILLVAVGDHLQRSEMLLVEIKNANPEAVFSFVDSRETAQDLVYANRLYRQTAQSAGDARVVGLLDDLERVLVEMAHGPEELDGLHLENLRERIESEGLIFKIRVAGARLGQEETL